MGLLNLKNCQYGIKKRRELENKQNNSCDFRIYVIFFLIFLFFGAIILKLYSIQVFSYGYYKALANDQHSVFKNLIPQRGEIFLKDKEGLYPVAVNKNVKMVYAVPREMDNPALAAKFIAEILGFSDEDLEKKFEKPNDSYEMIKHRLSEEEGRRISDLKIKGIHLADESYRYYPAGELASNVLGFMGWKEDDFGGRYGLEAYFESELKGREGKLFQNKDNSGSWISTGKKEIAYAQDGNDLILTIDHIIQYETEKILRSAVERYDAKKGTIIVMEPSTGKILAMANYPNFNPNDYGKVEDMEDFKNIAVSGAYECGSVFKTFTLAAAIDNGKINPDTTYVDTGNVSEAGYNIKNSDLKANGLQNMTQVLEKSLNTGVIYAENLLGNKNFSDYIRRFGFGELTEINLPGENAGDISNLKNLKRNIQFFTASFGQGITVTPIQLISAYNTIANGGILMKPQLVEKIIYGNGSEEEIAPQRKRVVISPAAANQATQMLLSVVVNGHGKQANVPGYLVGGKTGTAQIASQEKKGYMEDKNIGSFVGFAPLNNPAFTILVRLDEPKNVEWAESSAAPTFGELMKFLLDYKNIKPTENFTQADLDKFNRTHTLKQDFIKKEEENKQEQEDDK